MGAWSMSNGYDPLNRLTAASSSSGAYAGLQISWGYDPFGNRTSESFSGTSQMPVPTNSTSYYNTNNQISSTSLGTVQYDAAGGVTADNRNQYLYDGEGRVCAIRNLMFGTMTGYVYGADGMRISTGTITTWGSCDPSANGYVAMKDSILGPTGGQLTETGRDTNGAMAWSHTNVWAAGELIATYDPNGLHFYLTDWLGSRRVQTNYQGVVEQTCANLPYGDGETCGPDPSEELYAGLERDSDAGLDNAMYRSYASAFGPLLPKQVLAILVFQVHLSGFFDVPPSIRAGQSPAVRSIPRSKSLKEENWGGSPQFGPSRSVRKVCGIFVAHSGGCAHSVDITGS